MKIRNGFVSNSSSCSFTCDVCGNNEAGSDCCGIDEFGFFQCENGHTICLDEMVDADSFDEEESEEGHYSVAERHCPICAMKAFADFDVLKYLLKASGKQRFEVNTEIGNRFASYTEFKKFLEE